MEPYGVPVAATLGAASTSYIATTCKRQTTSQRTIIHSSLPSSPIVTASAESSSNQHSSTYPLTGLDLTINGCSRTIPVATSWTAAAAATTSTSYKHAQFLNYDGNCGERTSAHVLQVSGTIYFFFLLSQFYIQ